MMYNKKYLNVQGALKPECDKMIRFYYYSYYFKRQVISCDSIET